MPVDVAETLAPAVREVIGKRQGGLLTFGILATLWCASSGVEALRTGLDRAYRVTAERAVWWRRLQSMALVIGVGLVIFFLSVGVVLGPVVWRVLGPGADRLRDARLAFGTARYVTAAVSLLGSLLLLHRWLPNRSRASSPAWARPRRSGCSWLPCSPGTSGTLPTTASSTAASAG